ncbi:hypothetical protein EDEG_01082 [Edhazardia aedis USNM 41457]|uniref:Uncharacterized protein n=1 Tax=Edhazardia aedis (strain USNM 41457) TaxID=1003232 RepID=J9DB48_EDHAE|nr:hypothetical protein EDEG_01082 [Edhazardia aedis USNM 41457]|eukprot:EJW04719.1 hypothetical protein EDEG_01082 [Edhazardia aedis USNM 41457]
MINVPQLITRNVCKFFNKSICACILILMLISQMMTFSASFDFNPTPINQNVKIIKEENNTNADLGLGLNVNQVNTRPVQQHLTEEITKNGYNNDFLNVTNQIDIKNNNSLLKRYPYHQKQLQMSSNPRIAVKVTENQITLDILINKINDGDESILYEQSIDNLFDELSDIDLFDEMFYYKLKLFKLILNSEYCKTLFENVGGLNLIDEEALSIIGFSKNHLKMKELYHKHNFIYKKEDWRTFYCKKQGILSGIVSHEADFLKENYNFLKMFSGLFKLYWQKKFYTLNNHIKEHNINMDLGHFYDINHYYPSPYELKNVNFAKSFVIPILTHPDDGKIMAVLNLHSLDERHSQKLCRIQNHLQIAFNSIFRNCKKTIEFERLFTKDKNGNKRRLTRYGFEELTLFSYNARYIINEILTNNYMLSESDLISICKYYGGLEKYEKPSIPEENMNLELTDEVITLDIWNWGLEKKCDHDNERYCDSKCSNQISVYVSVKESK